MKKTSFLCYTNIGVDMKIGVDKRNYKQIKNDGNEYIYLFDDENFDELNKTNLHCIRYDKCNFVDINTTHFNIPCKRKANLNDNYDELFAYRNYKIAIIIPNYNYEHTIEKCLNSILDQTYKNYEIIFVDDMSTDNSVKLAEQILKNKCQHKIIQLKQKRFNGGARNEAYLNLSNDVDYVYYVDSDDWLYDNYALEKINNALQDEIDVLFVELASCYHNHIQIERLPDYKNKYEAMLGWSGSCGKVIKKELATRQECLYNEGTLKEDKNQHRKICIYMNTFDCLQEPIYVWNRDNHKSVTTIRDKIFWGTSTIRHYADLKQLYLSVKGNNLQIDRILEEALEKCKNEILRGGDKQY